MPKGFNADGSLRKRSPNAGRKPKPGSIMKTFRFAADVAVIFKSLLSINPVTGKVYTGTEFAEDALREKFHRETDWPANTSIPWWLEDTKYNLERQYQNFLEVLKIPESEMKPGEKDNSRLFFLVGFSQMLLLVGDLLKDEKRSEGDVIELIKELAQEVYQQVETMFPIPKLPDENPR